MWLVMDEAPHQNLPHTKSHQHQTTNSTVQAFSVGNANTEQLRAHPYVNVSFTSSLGQKSFNDQF
jgi:hypothetical protein